MSIKQLTKVRDNRNIAEEGRKITSKNLSSAALFPVKEDGTISVNSLGIFLLNPSQLDEAKSVNWAKQTVPGQSDPILQWVSGGDRVLSFEALVTKEISALDSNNTIKSNDNVENIISVVGNIASSFFGINVNAINTNNRPKNQLEITDELNYYRSLAYPVYNDAGKLQNSPPLLVFYDGGAIAKLNPGIADKITPTTDLWVLTDLKIRVTKQLPNLAPMEATVTFTLLQYTIKSFDSGRFHGKL